MKKMLILAVFAFTSHLYGANVNNYETDYVKIDDTIPMEYLRMGLAHAKHKFLMVHGAMSSPGFFLPLASEIRKRFQAKGEDAQIILPNMMVDVRGMETYDTMQPHLIWANLLNQLPPQLNLGHYSVISHSMGSSVAMRHMIDHKDKVKAAVFFNPVVDGLHNLPGALGEFQRSSVDDIMADKTLPRRLAKQFMQEEKPMRASILSMNAKLSDRDWIQRQQRYQDFGDGVNYISHTSQTLDIPTTYVLGSDDKVKFDNTHVSDLLFDRTPNANIVQVGNSSHSLAFELVEKAADIVMQTLKP